MFSMSINDYPKSELAPRKLSKEEIENPYQVLDNFFDFDHLLQIREELWQMLKLTVSSSYHIQPRRDRANLLYFMRSWSNWWKQRMLSIAKREKKNE